MKFPFFSRVQVKKVVPASGGVAAQQAERLLANLLAELPELLLAYVFDVRHSTLLASYTIHADYNPHHLTLRNAKVLQVVQQALGTGAWPGGACSDMTTLLDTQLHYLRPLDEQGWYCFVAVELAHANLGLVKAVVRRAIANSQLSL